MSQSPARASRTRMNMTCRPNKTVNATISTPAGLLADAWDFRTFVQQWMGWVCRASAALGGRQAGDPQDRGARVLEPTSTACTSRGPRPVGQRRRGASRDARRSAGPAGTCTCECRIGSIGSRRAGWTPRTFGVDNPCSGDQPARPGHRRRPPRGRRHATRRWCKD